MIGTILFLITIIFLFIPSFVAFGRDGKSKWTLLVVNVIFGWTILIWFLILAWAFLMDPA